MKRSRIFLGVTTALLAVAGIAAAKARLTTPITVYYETAVTAGHCYAFQQLYTANGLGSRGYYTKTISPLVRYAAYTKSNCTVPAYLSAQ